MLKESQIGMMSVCFSASFFKFLFLFLNFFFLFSFFFCWNFDLFFIPFFISFYTVPHLPNEEQDPFDPFHHVPQECWEQKSGPEFILCDADNGEDPHCSDSVLIPDSVDDHLHYFGVYETCSG